MDAKEFLMQVNVIRNRIELNEVTIANLKALATKVNHPIEGERVQGSRNPDPMGKAVISYIVLEDENERLLKELEKKQKEVTKMIMRTEKADVSDVLFKRYLLDMKFKDIASEKDKSIKVIFDLHRKGLDIIDGILGDNMV